MAFAVTTNASSTPDDAMTRYFTTAGKVVELSTSAAPASGDLVVAVGAAIGSEHRRVEPRAGQPASDGLPAIQPGHVDPTLEDALAREDRGRAAVSVVAPELAAATVEPIVLPLTSIDEPELAPGDRVSATVSFYYCQRGDQGLHPGDGGGFCGVMRDGSVVYPGAAACAYKYLGQRFRIHGDPLDRVYLCADTGSAVHGLHRDIWFMTSDEGWDWQLDIGQVATIEILP